jgi:hypothetical protein
MRRMAFAALAWLLSSVVQAAGWCNVLPGYRVTTHGNNSENVWLYGTLEGQSSAIWMQIATGSTGKSNVAVALAAEVSGRNLLVYVDLPEHTCANFPNWSSAIRHLQIAD